MDENAAAEGCDYGGACRRRASGNVRGVGEDEHVIPSSKTGAFRGVMGVRLGHGVSRNVQLAEDISIVVVVGGSGGVVP